MAKISDLNKRERELKNTLEGLKRDYRKNQISKNDYDSAIKDKQKDLDKISEDKKNLIGKLPPIPSAPVKSSPLSEIKKEVITEKPILEKPAEKKEEPKKEDKPVEAKEKEEPKKDDKSTETDKTEEKKESKKGKSVVDKLVERTAKEQEKPAAKKTKTITVKETTVDRPAPVVREPMPSVDDSQTKISRALKRMGDETDAETIKKVFEETQNEFLK